MLNNLSHTEAQRVLIVDDTPQNLDVLGKTLRPLGYNLSVAQSGEQAIKIALYFRPDLILLDVMMPGIDGYETCKQLKSIEQLKDVPVIFVTAKHDAEDIVHGFDVGGVDYINKPFVQEEVCARVKLHLELYTARIDLEKLNHQKNRFLGIAAHDLRNPLTAIMGFSELMLEDARDNELDIESVEKRSTMIYAASNTMYQLINDLLDISIIEEGNFVLHKADTLLHSIILSRVEISRVLSARKQIKVDFECDESIRYEVDSNRFSQVIDNVLGNAIKYSPEHSVVLVEVVKNAEAIVISVKDNGPGIPADEQSKIFDAFQTLSTKPTGGEKSTGLGMSIVRKIVQAHGGDIRVDSRVGEGTTIIITLPLG